MGRDVAKLWLFGQPCEQLHQPSALLNILGGAKLLTEHCPTTYMAAGQCSFPLHRSWHLQLQLQPSSCWEKLRALPEPGSERCAQGEACGDSALPGRYSWHAPAQHCKLRGLECCPQCSDCHAEVIPLRFPGSKDPVRGRGRGVWLGHSKLPPGELHQGGQRSLVPSRAGCTGQTALHLTASCTCYCLFAQRGWLGEWIQPKKKTLGAMDFGGASTQITFETRDTIEDPRNEVMLKLYGQPYKVYTHSFLCYGRDQVLKRLLSKLLQQAENYQATVSNPCWPTGYHKSLSLSSIYDSPCTEKERPSLPLNTFVAMAGTGNGSLCALHVSKLFNFTTCSFSRCSFDGIFQPEVSGNFIAFSAFFYTVDFIQTVMERPVHLPKDLKDAAETICATSWSELLQKAPKLEKRLSDYCATSMFVYLLTTRGYNFNNHSFPNIAFQKKAGETSIGWALGYMLNLTNMIPAEKPASHKSMLYNYWVILILLFVVTTLTALVTAVYLLRHSKSSAI
uniref:Ectonucleoside triphosphate diphosphohydrolase 2 n=1 Tax=Cairina moschata TaxID=8855 RepID=A0A8C3CHQ0_CAIMO